MESGLATQTTQDAKKDSDRVVPPTLHSSLVQDRNMETKEKHIFSMNLSFDQIMEAFDFFLDSTSQIISQAGRAGHQNKKRNSKSATSGIGLGAFTLWD